ncbi:MAG TPA: ABC transporter ATP-binding protein [Candidatus Nanoarchaeia archaeon]|nr:ABC transporter ATP-binding protein [Candidatus Nanoarchaeia archaeon]
MNKPLASKGSLLRINDLHAGYGELQILKGVSLEVKPGEIVALIGPNGAGKSTVIKSIYNIADVDKGSIDLQGKDITGLKTHQLLEEGVSYVNQGRIVFADLSVRENLEIGAAHIKDKEVIQKNLSSVFKRFPILKERQHIAAYTLSGGQRQMLAIGRALMHSPLLLMLDEPSLGLSPKLQQEIFKIIEGLRDEGIAILIVEQNAKRAIEIADRTYLLEDGKVVLSGGKEILKDQRIRNVYLGGR